LWYDVRAASAAADRPPSGEKTPACRDSPSIDPSGRRLDALGPRCPAARDARGPAAGRRAGLDRTEEDRNKTGRDVWPAAAAARDANVLRVAWLVPRTSILSAAPPVLVPAPGVSSPAAGGRTGRFAHREVARGRSAALRRPIDPDRPRGPEHRGARTPPLGGLALFGDPRSDSARPTAFTAADRTSSEGMYDWLGGRANRREKMGRGGKRAGTASSPFPPGGVVAAQPRRVRGAGGARRLRACRSERRRGRSRVVPPTSSLTPVLYRRERGPEADVRDRARPASSPGSMNRQFDHPPEHRPPQAVRVSDLAKRRRAGRPAVDGGVVHEPEVERRRVDHPRVAQR
ncbi:MAG: hypothetical protein JWO31_4315, partial [Phycisphaerales bacterium]|nr:hypothetical protein [Phycisphaerales bacterium]